MKNNMSSINKKGPLNKTPDIKINEDSISDEWFAGFVDAEGSISLVLSNQDKCLTGIIVVTNTNLKLIESIKNKYGGKMYPINNNSQKRKIAYHLCWFSNKSFIISDVIKKHCILKYNHLNVFSQAQRLKFLPKCDRWELLPSTSPTGIRRHKYVLSLRKEIIEENKILFRQMKKLNSKGRKVLV